MIIRNVGGMRRPLANCRYTRLTSFFSSSFCIKLFCKKREKKRRKKIVTKVCNLQYCYTYQITRLFFLFLNNLNRFIEKMPLTGTAKQNKAKQKKINKNNKTFLLPFESGVLVYNSNNNMELLDSGIRSPYWARLNGTADWIFLLSSLVVKGSSSSTR